MVVGWRTNWFVHIEAGRLSLTWRIMKAGQRLRFYSILAFLLCSGDPVITVTYCHRVFLSMFPVRYPKKKWIQSIWLQGQRKQRFYRKRRRNSKLEFFIREQCLVMNIKDKLSILNQVVFISRLVVIAHRSVKMMDVSAGLVYWCLDQNAVAPKRSLLAAVG